MAETLASSAALVNRLPGNLSILDVITRYERWQYFASLTLRGIGGRTPKVVMLPGMLMVLREHASMLGVPFSRLVWCLRAEHGERFGRLHYHALISAEGEGAKKPTIGNSYRLRSVWARRFGWADVRVYDRRQHGAAYVVKCLGYRDTSGMNAYELSKFGQGIDAILSDSLIRYLGQHRMRSTVDGSEVGHWSEGRLQVSPAEKWARCEVSQDRTRFFRVPSLTVKLSPKNDTERLSTEAGVCSVAWGGWHFGLKPVAPDVVAMFNERVNGGHPTDRKRGAGQLTETARPCTADALGKSLV